MPSKTFVIAAALIGLGLAAAYFYMPGSEPIIDADNSAPLIMDDQQASSFLSEIPPALPDRFTGFTELPSESSLLELEVELALTVSKREEIEDGLRVVELKIGALEAKLDNIERRGDNPADVQNETLDAFQALFAEYQDEIMTFEQIETKEMWLKDKISDLKK